MIKNLIGVISLFILIFTTYPGLAEEGKPPDSVEKSLTVVYEEPIDEEGNYKRETYTVRSSWIMRGEAEGIYNIIKDYPNWSKWVPNSKDSLVDKEGVFYITMFFKVLGKIVELPLKLFTKEKIDQKDESRLINVFAKKDFEYKTIKNVNQFFKIYYLYDNQTKTIVPGRAWVDVVSDTKVGWVVSSIPPEKVKPGLAKTTRDMFLKLQEYINAKDELKEE